MRFLHHPFGGLVVSHDPHLCRQCKLGDHDACGPARCFHDDDARVTCACDHEEETS